MSINIKTLIYIFVIPLIIICPYLVVAEEVIFVENNEARGVIYPTSSKEYIKKAATEVQRIIKESTGVEIPIVSSPQAGKNILKISTEADDGQAVTLSGDSFKITSPSETEIVIYGTTDGDAGTETRGMMGAMAYLMGKYVGVRWLFPGDIGEYIPKHDRIAFNRQEILEIPDYESRLFDSTAGDGDQRWDSYVWRYRNRIHNRGLKYSHNVYKIFPPSKFKNSHPEFYPTVDIGANRYIPANDSIQNWHPNFDAQGIDTIAINQINNYLNDHPEEKWYSLGINDSTNWDIGVKYEPGQYILKKPYNTIHQPDLSDYYYSWVKKVAEGINQSHPNIKIGLLAYISILDAPHNVTLPSNVTPFVTYDTMRWLTPEQKELMKNRLARWQEVVPQTGIWDYPFGETETKIPRLFSQAMSEYLKYAHAHGATDYFAEMAIGPYWTEGPKAYILAKILWDTNVNVQTVFNDWCESAVGNEAAVYLKRYYNFWEDYWSTKVATHNWFKRFGEDSVYPTTGNESYLNELTMADIGTLDTDIQNMLTNVDTAGSKNRAEFICRSWKKVKDDVYNLVNFKNISGWTDNDFSDFETSGNTFSTWYAWTTPGNPTETHIDHNVAHDGNSSLRIDILADDLTNRDRKLSTVKYEVSVPANKLVKIEGYIKSEGFVEADDAVSLGIYYWKKGNTVATFDSVRSAFQNIGSNDWQKVSFAVNTPDISNPKIYLIAQVNSKHDGHAWFDDVKISTINSPTVPSTNCSAPPMSCNSSHPGFCETKDSCTGNGNWCDGACKKNQCNDSGGNNLYRADTNGDDIVNATDALLALKKTVNFSLVDLKKIGWQETATTGDVNCDGVVSATDAMLILKEAVGGYSRDKMKSMGWCVASE